MKHTQGTILFLALGLLVSTAQPLHAFDRNEALATTLLSTALSGILGGIVGYGVGWLVGGGIGAIDGGLIQKRARETRSKHAWNTGKECGNACAKVVGYMTAGLAALACIAHNLEKTYSEGFAAGAKKS